MCISRVDSVDYEAIDDLTDLLLEIAEKFEGEYDGWETMVIEA
jgi:regulator of RNase E activity RraB